MNKSKVFWSVWVVSVIAEILFCASICACVQICKHICVCVNICMYIFVDKYVCRRGLQHFCPLRGMHRFQLKLALNAQDRFWPVDCSHPSLVVNYGPRVKIALESVTYCPELNDIALQGRWYLFYCLFGGFQLVTYYLSLYPPQKDCFNCIQFVK